MSGQVMWGKFALFSGLIMVTGWGIMRYSTPNEEEFYNSLAPDLKRKVDAVRAQRAGSGEIRQQIAASAETEQIVWGDQLGKSAGRKV